MATRRLPVIQEPTGEDAEAAARPAWHWVLIGAGMLVSMFMPLALAALALGRIGVGDPRASRRAKRGRPRCGATAASAAAGRRPRSSGID
jgi:hypothetical protein